MIFYVHVKIFRIKFEPKNHLFKKKIKKKFRPSRKCLREQIWFLNILGPVYRKRIKFNSNYGVETTYGLNSVISKLMTFVKNAETGQFLFLIILILSCLTCSWRHSFLSYDAITNFFKWQPLLFSSLSDRPSYFLNDELKNLVPYMTIFLRKLQILLPKFNLIFNVKIFNDLKQKQINI
jgi:hypothetical protein